MGDSCGSAPFLQGRQFTNHRLEETLLSISVALNTGFQVGDVYASCSPFSRESATLLVLFNAYYYYEFDVILVEASVLIYKSLLLYFIVSFMSNEIFKMIVNIWKD